MTHTPTTKLNLRLIEPYVKEMATTIDVVKPEPLIDDPDPPKILGFETVASYNWLDEPEPTILVPGQLLADG